MAYDSSRKGIMPGPAITSDGPGYAGPPPSTLAAQLVENISASTKSSRSDENSELKGLFAVIQRVKDNPQLLKTIDERIEHNHMLIYVYARVVLEGIKFDDPFLDRTHLRAEILKAINFLRFTVKETPSVLGYCALEGKLMFRGSEPLWIWLFPQLLRLLGHPHCIELSDNIENLIQYFLLVMAQTGALWDLSPLVIHYLRTMLTGILRKLQDTSLPTNQKDAFIELRLPYDGTLDRILDKEQHHSYHRFTYEINRVPQAIHQARSLANVLIYPLISGETAFESVASFSESSLWLLDTLLDLRLVERRWVSICPDSPAPVIEMILRLVKAVWYRDDRVFTLRNKACTLLVLLCSEMVPSSDNLITLHLTKPDVQRTYCVALLAITQTAIRDSSIARLASSLVHQLWLQLPSIPEESDMWRTIQTLKSITAVTMPQALDARLHPSMFRDIDILKAAEALSLDYEFGEDGEEIPAKKRKLSDSESNATSTLIKLIYQALKMFRPPYIDLDSLEQAYLDGFQKADHGSQCLAVDLLSRICCVADDESNKPCSSQREARDFKCATCDPDTVLTGRKSSGTGAYKGIVQRMFAALVRLPSLMESRRPRVATMVALKRVILHCDDPDVLNLETSLLGQWCLQSLSSSVRELRITAGRTLATFVFERSSPPSNQDLVTRNRKNSLALLRSISEKDQANLIETCIMAWGQLGRVMTENELNLVLIKLMEFLGSSNNVVSAFAFNELLNLAEARAVTPRRLFEPFWPSLAYMITKNMVHRPQMSRATAELFQISVNELLLLIQTHALPYLVLDKQKDVIQKIAEARQDKDVFDTIMDPSNIAAILALLMIQETDDIEGFTRSRLAAISPRLEPAATFPEVLKSEPVLTILELLKAGGDADEARKHKSRKALHTMATILLTSNKETKQKKANIVGRFLQTQMLGLMARFADVFNESMITASTVQEQLRYVRAMEEMIRVCRDYARIARPQISACLLSALSEDVLRESSLSCWAAMLTYLEEEDVESLLETTFFIVNHYWTSFDDNAKAIGKQMLDSLMKRYRDLIIKHSSKLPRLPYTELVDINAELQKLRPQLRVEEELEVFCDGVSHENSGVVLQNLSELVSFLEENQSTLHTSAVSQQPDTVIETLMRALLDCACKYSGIQADISRLCMRALGLVGCVDSNKIEAVREQRSIVVLNNFGNNEEVTDFVLFVLEVVLVPAFLSATDAKFQGFLSFAMQELLDRADIKTACAMQNVGMLGGNDIYRKWIALPEATREVITPFLASRYMVAPMKVVPLEYPVFRPGRPYANWLRPFVVDLLQKGQTPFAQLIYEPLARVIRVKDLTTSEFLLPYLVLHVFLGSSSNQQEKDNVLGELVSILQHQPAEDASYMEKEDMKRYCQAVFRVIDYAMRWIQAKRATGRLTETDKANLSQIQEILDTMPAELISQRAIDCNDYARALFHLEQHAQKMEQRQRKPGERTRLLERLQDIYANIDEPDGLDGISAHLHDLDINQQILSHRKAGRWTAVQSWYEMQLAEKPDNVDVQVDLLNCLKQAGQHDVLLNHIEGMHTDNSTDNKIMPFAVEAAWATARWESLSKFTKRFHEDVFQDFNVSLATIFEALHNNRNKNEFATAIREMRDRIAEAMNTSATASLQACHDLLLKCHVLTDLEIIIGAKDINAEQHQETMDLLDRRLEIIGGFFNDKQYLLGIRRAAMELTRPMFSDFDISGSWLSSAKLARKTNSLHQSFAAVLRASQLGDDAATIENAKLLWIDGHHRKAIQMLQGAIQRNKFMTQTGTSTSTGTTKLNPHQRLLTARAQLLLAKWLDSAGQTHASALREKYQQPPKTLSSWEKGHYYLGRHYKKILEAEKPLSVDDQTDNYLTGEISRLVIENYVRSLNAGTKYLYQTLPRILTIWLDMGASVDKVPEGKAQVSRELHRRRVEQLNMMHSFLDKYINRLPAYIFYTALPQIVARIAHPNPTVFDRLIHIVCKVVEAHPRQALWSLIGIMTSKQVSERKARGAQILQNLRNVSRKVDGTQYDMKYLLRMGEKLAEQLLLACHNGDFPGNKTVHASLTRELRFNHKCTPCPLVVPVESSLTATLPAVSEHVKKHRAFSRDVVSIDCFLDDVLVLSSLAKPRRLTARGTDGKSYMLLIKPKDDLRNDQRLMEFNGIINRSLKRDAESSRRQLYIRTYAVTPLNEECGIIEWVPGIKTMRDILISLYASRKIYPDYAALRQLMDEASLENGKIRIFTDDVLGRFPPMLQLWFTQQFPNPSAWFAARLRYSRSCAVMSMVGTILGLGDRHGENVNLEEGNGGVFHVDFNCLFDKGLTFAKPERVPFRLTHNMVAAMGIYGYEGPFRKSSELTLSILRQQEETLMTILEAFIYDPTLDLQKEKRSHRKNEKGVKLQPQSVVDSIRRKVKGLLPHESIPLGVEGQVDELIKQAVDPKNLAAMYIGWCPFL